MTPEQLQQFNEMQRKIDELTQKLESFNNSTTFSFESDQAFRTRFRLNEIPLLTVSSKGSTSENQAVDEAGSATYSVLKAPDGFLQVPVNGSTYYIPIFT